MSISTGKTERAEPLAALGERGRHAVEEAEAARDLAARFGLPDEAADMERIARQFAAESPYLIAHGGAVVQMLLARHEADEARDLFARLMSHLDGLPQDLLHLGSLALSEDAVALGDVDAAKRVYDALAPYADRFVVASGGVARLGSASHQLGMLLAARLGREDAARAHLETAVRAHREAACTRLLSASRSALEALRATTVSPRCRTGITRAAANCCRGARTCARRAPGAHGPHGRPVLLGPARFTYH